MNNIFEKIKEGINSISKNKPKVFFVCPFYKNPEWSPLIMRGFRKYFPNECFVAINNNPDKSPLAEIVTKNASAVLPPSEGFRHGTALDDAVKWGKKNRYDIMIVLEQDCRIEGNDWAKQMIKLIDKSGYDMVGTFTHWNYIHPSISAWRLNANTLESFEPIKKN